MPDQADHNDDSDLDLSDEEEHPSDLPAKEPTPPPPKMLKNRRQSVSAECYTPGQVATPIKVIPKSDEAKASIREIMATNILFQGLDKDQVQEVVDVVEEKCFPAAENIITQGEQGDHFYILEAGTAEVYLKIGSDPPAMVKTYKHGDSFGELALLYNSPRAATVKAVTDCTCWVMDRPTFRRIVADSAFRKRNLYEEFLREVPLLASLEDSERSAIADVLEPKYHEPGDYIITQGDAGDAFYLLETGEVEAKAGGTTVMNYKRGDYFGELALLNDEPRKADCIAKSKCKTVSMDRPTFKRLLGRLTKILQRNMEHYVALADQGLVPK
mmetsp:Transcript_18778/g.22503  ORF Transcript_18778/g.22503 Transcript_18778/m.22503 type:complete len:328 (-) Transcript_18778:683-1666(-)|eukprot:CAMPEP_0197851628 /NCGR_PEP_ID=MMETSP1438-20131217/18480_1 /TAXON_ID=1461541 /ORGANISM="Pterosperma sp., Strain CCMP1384" /LENGTH=327 /DNA_ID=CAMNT_0043465295 /DNA_START=207 /DNA_END=1190 /DNA_ORIENTATION=+